MRCLTYQNGYYEKKPKIHVDEGMENQTLVYGWSMCNNTTIMEKY